MRRFLLLLLLLVLSQIICRSTCRSDIDAAIPALSPSAAALFVQASAAAAQGNTDLALDLLHRADALQPNHSMILTAMGTVLHSVNRADEAAVVLRNAMVSGNPGDTGHETACLKLGRIYIERDMWEEAMDTFKHAIALYGHMPDALYRLVYLLHFSCDFNRRDSMLATVKRTLHAEVKTDNFSYMTPSQALMFLDEADIALVTRTFGIQNLERALTQRYYHRHPATARSWLGGGVMNAKKNLVRIAYMSRELGFSSVGQLLPRLFGAHDRTKFLVHAYSLGPNDDTDWRKRLQHGSDIWTDCGDMTPEQLASTINKHQVHILVDLTGPFSALGSQMLGLEPCQVAINFLGWLGPINARYMHFFIADRIALPPEHSSYYTEKLILMPDSYQINSNRYNHPSLRVDSSVRYHILSAAGITDPNAIIFSNFNQLFKLTPTCFETWMRILRQVPNSVLCLLKFMSTPKAEERIWNATIAGNVDPRRIVWIPFNTDKERFMEIIGSADVFLDNDHYNAGTTGTDVLYASVVSITIAGRRMLARMGASFAYALDFKTLVARNYDDYVAMAVRLAKNPRILMKMKRILKRKLRLSALFDADRWVEGYERALTALWDIECMEIENRKHIILSLL